MGDYTKHIEPNSHDEQFTIDLGDGNGYEVYYRKKNGCWWKKAAGGSASSKAQKSGK